jgi:hypothetical protein
MMSGIDVPVIFKVAESALDRVIDAFAVNPDEFVITNETRAVKDSFGEDYHDERIVKVQVRTTLEEAYRWALANADTVEIVTQDIRDKIARIADPIYQLYTQSLSDKVRENIDYVLKEGTFKITSLVDADTAYATYKELAIRGCLSTVNNINIAGKDDFDNLDYLGDFINTKRLIISAPQIKNMTWAAKLVNVETLKLTFSEINDTSWIKEMKQLKRLYWNESSVSDLSVLREHKEICDLDICGTNVSDISFIENFAKLEHLHIASCPIEDYSPLFTTQSHLKCLEIDKRALEEIGEENIRNHHIGITIKTTNDLFYWL